MTSALAGSAGSDRGCGSSVTTSSKRHTFPNAYSYRCPPEIAVQGNPRVYFRRFMTLVHISTSPFFASLSGRNAIDCMALSTYSWARARVCSRPVLSETISRA